MANSSRNKKAANHFQCPWLLLRRTWLSLMSSWHLASDTRSFLYTSGSIRRQSRRSYQQCHSHNNKINLRVVLLCCVPAGVSVCLFRPTFFPHNAGILFLPSVGVATAAVVVVKLSRWNVNAYEIPLFKSPFVIRVAFGMALVMISANDAFHVTFSHSFDILMAHFFLVLFTVLVRLLLLFFPVFIIIIGWHCVYEERRGDVNCCFWLASHERRV